MRNSHHVLLLGLVFGLQKLSSASCPKGSVQLAQNWTDYNWQWADGSAMDFTNWSQSQPNGEGTQRCVSINGRADAVGQWDDSDCSIRMRAAVCQTDPTYS